MIGKKWDNKSIAFLEKHYNGDMTIDEIAIKLNRSYKSIFLKARRLNLCNGRSKLSNIDIQFIKDNYKEISTNKLAKKFGVDTSTVRKVLQKHGLDNPRSIYSKAVKWRKEEERFLINNYRTYSLGVLAEYLDRTPKSIEKKALNLNLGAKGRPTYLESTAERIFSKILWDLGIEEFEKNKYVGKHFSVDFFLIEYKLCIEIQGEYFHVREYSENLTDEQKKRYDRDKRKKEYLLSLGYNVMYIWGNDLKNINKCKKFIINNLPPNLVNCGE